MKILIAEDERVSARQLEVVLTSLGYEVVVARDGVEAWDILRDAGAPKLAILDWMMPEKNGVELCRDVRHLRSEPYTYILLLTEKSGRQDIVEGMKAGADDYLTKPFDAKELEVRLWAGRRVLSLMDEVIAAREVLRQQATHDSLTGLLNRRATRELVRLELARTVREGNPVSVIMVDIDHFKRVNDTYGHMTGDAVLVAVAQRMRSQLRPYDCVGRYGGEEFLAVLPGCGAEDLAAKADALRDFIGQSTIETSDGPISVTASMGAAVYCGTDAIDPDDLIREADVALYRAKNAGRNRVEIARTLTGLMLTVQSSS